MLFTVPSKIKRGLKNLSPNNNSNYVTAAALTITILFFLVGTQLFNAQALSQSSAKTWSSSTITEGDKHLVIIMRANYDDQEQLVELYSLNMNEGDKALSHPNEENLEYTMQLPGEHGVQYFSLAQIKSNAASLKSQGVDIISYDIENEYSPSTDVENPVASVREACQVIHQNGMKCMVAPARSLTTQYGTLFAPYVDLYNIQAQALQASGCQTAYQSYVEDIVKKLRAINPEIKITSQVSTSRGTLENMKECFSTVADVVDGANNFYSNDQEGFDKLQGFVEWFDSTYR